GADGAASTVRDLAGIDISTHDYGQLGVVATVATELAHGRVARQRFLPGGPVAFLPLADGRCSIVWSQPADEAPERLDLSEEAFRDALTAASGRFLGAVTDCGERAAFPLRRQHAARYVGDRVALVGDAAHVIHPLAGQGANLGFLDAAALVECLSAAREAGRDPGGAAVLRRYERWRKGDNLLMQNAMDGFHQLFGRTDAATVGLRSLGLSVADRLLPLKQRFMAHAMGERGDLPALARAGGG
ncbi:FAD-dependent monooxygenase, partial [Ectothiorhodospiraceae bacterium WFHF3C12]|nr:FAD-dependent monooxygenase [Ectothiorhodospiraceae bacterium WFHF3C12]